MPGARRESLLPPFRDPHRLVSARGLACGAVAVVALLLFWPVTHPNLMRIGSEEPGPVFSRRVPDAEQILAPMMGTPAWPSVTVPALAARLSLALPFGTPLYRADAVVAATHAVAIGVLTAVAYRLTRSGIAALVAAAALATSATFAPRAMQASSQTMVAPLLVGMLWALVSMRPSQARWALAVLLGLGIGGNPEMVLLVPGLAWWMVRGASGGRGAVTAAAPIVGAGVIGLAWHAWAIDRAWEGLSRISKVGIAGSPHKVIAAGRGLLPGPETFASFRTVVQGLIAEEWGLLGVTLVALGFWWLAVRRRDVAIGLGTTVAIGFAWAAVTGGGRQQVALVPLLWLSYPVLACGVAWLEEMAGPKARIAAVALVCALPIANGLRHYDELTRLRNRQAFRADHLTRVLATLPSGSAVVTESEAFDRALIWMDRGRAGEPLHRIPAGPTPAALARVTGFATYAFDRGADDSSGGPNRWSRQAVAPIELSLPEYLAMLPHGTIVAIGAHDVGPGLTAVRRLESIGGRLDLSTGVPAVYGIVGLIGGESIVERLGSSVLDLRIQAGDRLGRERRDAPVTITIGGAQDGVRIAVNGDEVASASKGLAVAAVNSIGTVVGAFAVGTGHAFAPDWRLAPQLYRLD